MFAMATECVLCKVRAEREETVEHQTNNTVCVQVRRE
jgi:hypothetical protein